MYWENRPRPSSIKDPSNDDGQVYLLIIASTIYGAYKLWVNVPLWWAQLPIILSPWKAKLIVGASVLLIGRALFYIREHYGLLYGSMELGFAVGSATFAASRLSAGTGQLDFTIALFGSLYISVRGYDNINKGLQRRKAITAEVSTELNAEKEIFTTKK